MDRQPLKTRDSGFLIVKMTVSKLLVEMLSTKIL